MTNATPNCAPWTSEAAPNRAGRVSSHAAPYNVAHHMMAFDINTQLLVQILQGSQINLDEHADQNSKKYPSFRCENAFTRSEALNGGHIDNSVSGLKSILIDNYGKVSNLIHDL